MKPVVLIFVLLAFTSCTHTVLRKSYRFDSDQSPRSSAAITKNPGSPDSLINVGEVSLKDGWWVVICSESEALSLLRKEAHQLRADVIHITKEKRPDFESSCYRCDATFYQYKHRGMIVKSDSAYTDESIQTRHKKDNKKKAMLATGSVLLGLTIGILIGLALM